MSDAALDALRVGAAIVCCGLSLEPHELDTCECGDYRRDHVDGVGACRHNKPMDMTHGYKDCTRFRLFKAHVEEPTNAGE